MPATDYNDIANIALVELGQDTVSDITDSNERAEIALNRLHTARRAVLRQHPWNCALKRSTLTKEGSAPPFGYSFYHKLPVDCLRALRHSDITVPFRIEHGPNGRVIASDASNFYLVYICDIARSTHESQVANMDDLLIEAWAYKLAAAIALRLTGSDTKRKTMEALYQDRLNEARYTDSLEGSIGQLQMPRWYLAHLGDSGEPFRAIDA